PKKRTRRYGKAFVQTHIQPSPKPKKRTRRYGKAFVQKHIQPSSKPQKRTRRYGKTFVQTHIQPSVQNLFRVHSCSFVVRFFFFYPRINTKFLF
ncbi:MAG: hypothetical protein J6S21_07055, partial [Victivallales bacterium]|nr:hypothetical protein [Victivallales bacterium]